jgi:hypothetical protein
MVLTLFAAATTALLLSPAATPLRVRAASPVMQQADAAAAPADTRFAGVVVPTGGKTSLQTQLDANRALVDSLGSIAPKMSEVERLRFAMAFPEKGEAEEAIREAVAWRAGAGKTIVESAAAAVAQARAGGGWDNEPVRAAAPNAAALNAYITTENVLTLNTPEGDLVYVIRASGIEDKEMMSKVSVDQLVDFLLYVKEVHWLCVNARTEQTGRICEVIFANDITGTRKAPDPDFSKALTGSSKSYTKLYPSLAGPTLILNLPFILQAFVGLFKPLFPKAVQERLKFEKAKYLSELKELTPLTTDANALKTFLGEVKGITNA